MISSATLKQWKSFPSGLFVMTGDSLEAIERTFWEVPDAFVKFPLPLQDAHEMQEATKEVRKGKRVVVSLGRLAPPRVMDALYTRNMSRESISAHLKGICYLRELPPLCPHCAIPDERVATINFAAEYGIPPYYCFQFGKGCSACALPKASPILAEQWSILPHAKGCVLERSFALERLKAMVLDKEIAIASMMAWTEF